MWQGPEPSKGPEGWQLLFVMLSGPEFPGDVVPTEVAPSAIPGTYMAGSVAGRAVESGSASSRLFLFVWEHAVLLPSQGCWGGCKGSMAMLELLELNPLQFPGLCQRHDGFISWWQSLFGTREKVCW